MKKLVFVKLAGILILLWLLLPARQEAAHALGCASPLTPGHWAGSFGALTEVKQPDDPFTIDTTIHYGADIDLNIDCNGQITGNIFTKAGSTGDTTSDFVHGTWEYSLTDPQDIMDESATCDLTVNWQVLTGKVRLGDGGAPRIDWKFKTGFPGADCSGDDDLVNLMKNVAQGTKDSLPFALRDVTWQAKATDWSPDHAGSDVPWDDPIGAPVISMLQKGGASVTQIANWSISLVGATPTVAPTKTDDKIPIVTGVTGKLQQVFLEKIPAVSNTYTAMIDWQGGTPKEVDFKVGDLTVVDSSPGAKAQALIPMDSLPAGNNSLNVVAVSSKGQSSQPLAQDIVIVPVPAWAQSFNLAGSIAGKTVLYKSTTSRAVPPQPENSSVIVPMTVPYLNGEWGFKGFQFQADLTASSMGNSQDAQIVGAGKYIIAGTELSYIAKSMPNSFVRASINIPQNTLSLDDSAVDLLALPGNFPSKVTAQEAFPGLDAALLSEPQNGPALQLLASTLAPPTLNVPIEVAGAKLGVQGNDVVFTVGKVTSNLALTLPPPQYSPEGIVMLVGGANGSVTFDLAPKLTPSNCVLAGALKIAYGSFMFLKDYQPTAFLFPTCADFESGAGGGSPVLASPQQLDTTPAHLLPRSDAWQPEQVVANPTETSANGVTTTTLIEKAGALVANPALSSGPNGRMALAWVGETSDHPRPQAFQARLRLFDGKSWGAAITLSDNTQPDFFPSVAVDGKGEAVVAWVQNKDANLQPDATLTQDFLKDMEIAYAVVDSTGKIVKTGTLTNDSALDFGPEVSVGTDGTVWLAWQSNSDDHLTASVDSPSMLKAARWNGQEWSAPEPVYVGIKGPINWQIAAYDAQTALVVIALQSGGFENTLAIERSRSGWAAPFSLASNLVGGIKPWAAYSSKGKPVAAWSWRGGISGVIGDLKAGPSLWLTDTTAIEGLVAGGGGTLALALSGEQGLLLSQYDPQANLGFPQKSGQEKDSCSQYGGTVR